MLIHMNSLDYEYMNVVASLLPRLLAVLAHCRHISRCEGCRSHPKNLRKSKSSVFRMMIIRIMKRETAYELD